MQADQLPVPRDKYDLAAVSAIVEADWQAASPPARLLLGWIQDANWPVATVLAPFLAAAGAELAPLVREVLMFTDETWKYNLIQSVVLPSRELTEALKADLQRIAERPTAAERWEEVNIVAQEALDRLTA